MWKSPPHWCATVSIGQLAASSIDTTTGAVYYFDFRIHCRGGAAAEAKGDIEKGNEGERERRPIGGREVFPVEVPRPCSLRLASQPQPCLALPVLPVRSLSLPSRVSLTSTPPPFVLSCYGCFWLVGAFSCLGE